MRKNSIEGEPHVMTAIAGIAQIVALFVLLGFVYIESRQDGFEADAIITLIVGGVALGVEPKTIGIVIDFFFRRK